MSKYSDEPKSNLSRADWENMARVDDIYYQLYNDWDIRCRERSSTGENMVKENMSPGDFSELKTAIRDRAVRLASFSHAQKS